MELLRGWWGGVLEGGQFKRKWKEGNRPPEALRGTSFSAASGLPWCLINKQMKGRGAGGFLIRRGRWIWLTNTLPTDPWGFGISQTWFESQLHHLIPA